MVHKTHKKDKNFVKTKKDHNFSSSYGIQYMSFKKYLKQKEKVCRLTAHYNNIIYVIQVIYDSYCII